MGDFNFDMLTASPNTRFIHDFIQVYAFFMPVTSATHHTLTSHTLLDLCMVDSLTNIADFSQSGYPFLPGHELLSLTY